MLKKITALLVAFVMFLSITTICPSSTAIAAADGTGTYIVQTRDDSLNIRKGTSTSYERVGEIPSGASVNVTKIKDGWGYVTYGGKTGWISLDYCSKKGSGSSGGKVTDSGKYANVSNYQSIYNRLNELRAKFPNGKYWNWMGKSAKDVDSWTNTPCPSNGRHTDTSHCNGQCDGFARKLGLDLFGVNTSKWETKKYSIDTICVGDLIRYNSTHTIMVIGFTNDKNNLIIADCNWNCNCNIRWDANFSTSRYLRTVNWVLHYQGNTLNRAAYLANPPGSTKPVSIATTTTKSTAKPTTTTTTKATTTTTRATTVPAPKKLTISATSILIGKNNSQTLKVNADDKQVTPNWSCDNYAVCTVEKDGKVTGFAPGKAKVIAEYGGKTVSCSVTVKAESIRRIAGSDRIDTANKVAQTGWTNGSTNVVLANSQSFADALAGVPLAKELRAPILLTAGKKLESSVSIAIGGLGAVNVFLLGGTSVISSDVEKALTNNGYKVVRLSGANRYETSAKIAEELRKRSGRTPNEAFFVDGTSFPDAIAVSSAAAACGSPILYAPKSGAIDRSVANYLNNCKGINAVIIGSSKTIAASTEENIAKNGVAGVSRISGSDRYDTSAKICTAYRERFNKGGIFLTTGKAYPDALSGGAYAALLGYPVVLADGSKAPADALKLYDTLNVNSVFIMGGTNAVSDETANAFIK